MILTSHRCPLSQQPASLTSSCHTRRPPGERLRCSRARRSVPAHQGPPAPAASRALCARARFPGAAVARAARNLPRDDRHGLARAPAAHGRPHGGEGCAGPSWGARPHPGPRPLGCWGGAGAGGRRPHRGHQGGAGATGAARLLWSAVSRWWRSWRRRVGHGRAVCPSPGALACSDRPVRGECTAAARAHPGRRGAARGGGGPRAPGQTAPPRRGVRGARPPSGLGGAGARPGA